jgi:sulfopyruvate decarboxylase subunit alpha
MGFTHVVTLPDNTSAPILELFQRKPGKAGQGPVDGAISLITATREGEALGIASGLWLGGARPAVLIQNTGLLEAGDALRGTAARMGIPLLLLVTCRGYAKARAAGFDPAEPIREREKLVRSDLDSVAFMTEPTLDAWGIPYFHMTDSSDLGPVEDAVARARDEERPVAVLIDTSFV